MCSWACSLSSQAIKKHLGRKMYLDRWIKASKKIWFSIGLFSFILCRSLTSFHFDHNWCVPTLDAQGMHSKAFFKWGLSALYKWSYLYFFSLCSIQVFASPIHYVFYWHNGVALIHYHKGLADRWLLMDYKWKTTGKSCVAAAKMSNLRCNGLPFYSIEQQQN